MLSVMRFWLKKGVDGFRVDVMWHLMKDRYFRDNPPNPEYREGMLPSKRLVEVYSADQPEVQDIVTMMRAVVDEFDKRLLIGEVYLSVDELVDYYGRQQSLGAHLPYNFQLVVLPWKATDIYVAINKYEGSLPEFAWPNWVLGNHDKDRIATRVGPEQARVAALAVADAAGHSHHLLRRGDRDAERARAAGEGARSDRENVPGSGPRPGPAAGAHAVERRAACGILLGRALAARRGGLWAGQRGKTDAGRRLHAHVLPPADPYETERAGAAGAADIVPAGVQGNAFAFLPGVRRDAAAHRGQSRS